MTPPKRRRRTTKQSSPSIANTLGPMPRRTDWWAVSPMEWLRSAKAHGGRRRLLADRVRSSPCRSRHCHASRLAVSVTVFASARYSATSRASQPSRPCPAGPTLGAGRLTRSSYARPRITTCGSMLYRARNRRSLVRKPPDIARLAHVLSPLAAIKHSTACRMQRSGLTTSFLGPARAESLTNVRTDEVQPVTVAQSERPDRSIRAPRAIGEREREAQRDRPGP